MDSQKGSVKDRLRARMLFLEYKRNKKKKENELKKQKKLEYEARIRAEQIRIYGRPYNKAKLVLFIIFGLIMNIFIPKSSKEKIEKELVSISQEKKQILINLEQDHDVKEVYDHIHKTYQKLEDLKKKYKIRLIVYSFNPTNKENMLDKIDKQQRELIVINEICHNKEKQLKQNVNFDIQNNKSPFLQKQNKKDNNEKEGEGSKIEFDDSKSLDNALKVIKNISTNIKEYNREMDILNGKIDKETLYNTLYHYEFKLKKLLLQLNKLLENYKLLAEQLPLNKLDEIIDIDIIDKYELRFNEKNIIKRIDTCKLLLEKIEIKKSELSSNKVIEEEKTSKLKDISNLNIDKEKDKKVEEEKKELKEQFNDIYLANKMIINNILEERKMVEKLKRKMANQSPIVRKRVSFFQSKNFFNKIFDFGFSLLPMKFFRNKFLGRLTMAIMLNNTLKTTKKLLTLDTCKINYILCSDILREIKSSQDYISENYEICLDSLSQIRSIKEYLNANYSMVRDYDSELADFNRKLNELSEQIESQIEILSEISNNYGNMENKIKVKINYNNII